MPHVHIKIAGKSETEKARLADKITKAIMIAVACKEADISVSIENVDPSEWVEKVYKPDILAQWDKLYKKPDYGPL
jgi:4-oxalocrotonate tautomerase